MKISYAALAATLFAAAPAYAEPVKAGSYKIDPPHTEVLFSVSHFGLSNFAGMIAGVEGALKLDPAKLDQTQLDVSIATDTVLTPVAKLTSELKDAEWLDSAKFPKARFVSKKVAATGEGQADIEGDFTLHGVTKPLALHAHFVGAGLNPIKKTYTVGFQATGVVKRTDFGVSKYAPYVGDDVTLTINAAFEAAN